MRDERTNPLPVDVPENLKGTRAALFSILRQQNQSEVPMAKPARRPTPPVHHFKRKPAEATALTQPWQTILLEDVFCFSFERKETSG
ncbi:hypothetical protein ACEWPJ_01215 [Aliiroseovarius sp. YM-037]